MKWQEDFYELYAEDKKAPAVGYIDYFKARHFIQSLLDKQAHDNEILVNTILETKDKHYQEEIQNIINKHDAFPFRDMKIVEDLQKLIKLEEINK